MWRETKSILKKGGIAVIPTDTIYGIVGSAFSKKTVGRIFLLKHRNIHKPLIVLISSFSDLKKFGIVLSKNDVGWLKNIWPGKVSVILPCSNKKFEYIHRGTHTIAFRMVGMRNKNLFDLLKHVGPLVAPSANPEGLSPAKNVREAKKYFGEKVDIYQNGGTKISKPSTLVEYKEGQFYVLRQGAVTIKK